MLTGKIEYERKINIYAQMQEWVEDDDDQTWFERFKENRDKFNVSYFDLEFDSTRSIYKPGRELEDQPKIFVNNIAATNMVLTDYVANRVRANKKIYEQTFFVHDSLRRMEWRLKDEVRIIADHQCRKAVGKIYDSVYVVAFYADDIPVSGGPEMFGGLPGMILELAIPRLHTTWAADSIQMTIPKSDDFSVPEKGKSVTEEELAKTIKESFTDWGKMLNRNLWWSLL
jgi:GLPGLI family protein